MAASLSARLMKLSPGAALLMVPSPGAVPLMVPSSGAVPLMVLSPGAAPLMVLSSAVLLQVYDGGPAGTVPVSGGGTASYRNASELCNAEWKTAFVSGREDG